MGGMYLRVRVQKAAEEIKEERGLRNEGEGEQVGRRREGKARGMRGMGWNGRVQERGDDANVLGGEREEDRGEHERKWGEGETGRGEGCCNKGKHLDMLMKPGNKKKCIMKKR